MLVFRRVERSSVGEAQSSLTHGDDEKNRGWEKNS